MNNHLSNLLITPAMEWDGIAYEGGTDSLQRVVLTDAGEVKQEGVPLIASFLSQLPPVCNVLRDYQHAALAKLRDTLAAGYRRPVVQAPTGAGKTHLIAAVAAAACQHGLRVLVLATRSRLVRQIHERLEDFGVVHGVIAATLPELRNNSATVQVASVDTLHRRSILGSSMPLPGADVVLFDECHLAAAPSRFAILQGYPVALRIGLSATPARKSGRGLGQVFDSLIQGPSMAELISACMLVRPRIYNVPLASQEELAALPKDAGDYQSGALGSLLSRPKLIGDVVGNWLRLAAGKRSIVFACNKAHGALLVEQFTQAGVAAELLTDNDPESMREEVYARLESGNTTVLVNVFLAAYGIDLPTVEAIVLARPTRSLVMYLQQCGRGMRPAPGKADFLLIDHGRCVDTLGLPHIPREWTLDEGRNVNAEARERVGKAVEEKPRTCIECGHMWLVSESGEACRECGWLPAPKPKAVRTEHADLGELEYDEKAPLTPQSPEVVQFFREAVYWYGARWPDRWKAHPAKARGFAWFKTKEKFGFGADTPIPRAFWREQPSPTTAPVNGWLKSREIRYFNRRRA